MKNLLSAIAISLLLSITNYAMADEVKNVTAELELCPGGWISGPFYITACGWWECPTWYPPGAHMPVEHCPSNGLIRISKEYRSERGQYIDFSEDDYSQLFQKEKTK